MKIAYIDVCNTITNFFTLGPFIRGCILRHSKSLFVLYFINLMLNKVFGHFSTTKKLAYLKGIPSHQYIDFCQEFYTKNILPNLNSATTDKIKYLQKNGYKIVLVSAALEDYLTPLSSKINADAIIASTVDQKDNFLTGEVSFNYQNEKVERIKAFESKLPSPPTYRTVITDHISDLPMLKIADEAIVTIPGSTELIEIAKTNNWEIINNESSQK